MLERAGSTAAPLLATVSFALIALVLELPPGTSKWSGAAVILLVLAGLLLVGSVQAILWAKTNETGGWALLARTLYDTGTLALIAAVVVILLPHNPVPTSRWIAIGIGSLGFSCELIWVCSGLVMDVRGFLRSSDIDRWENALDTNLTDDEVRDVRYKLRSQGISTSRSALRRSTELGHPIGIDDVV